MINSLTVSNQRPLSLAPAAGWYNPNNGNSSYGGTNGNYWSSTSGGNGAYNVNFNNNNFNASNSNNTSNYNAVRLVQHPSV